MVDALINKTCLIETISSPEVIYADFNVKDISNSRTRYVFLIKFKKKILKMKSVIFNTEKPIHKR